MNQAVIVVMLLVMFVFQFGTPLIEFFQPSGYESDADTEYRRKPIKKRQHRSSRKTQSPFPMNSTATPSTTSTIHEYQPHSTFPNNGVPFQQGYSTEINVGEEMMTPLQPQRASIRGSELLDIPNVQWKPPNGGDVEEIQKKIMEELEQSGSYTNVSQLIPASF